MLCRYVEFFVVCTIYHGVTRLGCPVVSQVKPMVQSPGFPPSIVWDNWSVAAAAAAIRQHRSTMDVDAAYCYQLSSVVCLSVTLVSPAKTAELIIQMPFGLRTRVIRRKHRFDHICQVAPLRPHGKAHWRHLGNTVELSICGGDAVSFQITLTTCCCCEVTDSSDIMLDYTQKV